MTVLSGNLLRKNNFGGCHSHSSAFVQPFSSSPFLSLNILLCDHIMILRVNWSSTVQQRRRSSFEKADDREDRNGEEGEA